MDYRCLADALGEILPRNEKAKASLMHLINRCHLNSDLNRDPVAQQRELEDIRFELHLLVLHQGSDPEQNERFSEIFEQLQTVKTSLPTESVSPTTEGSKNT